MWDPKGKVDSIFEHGPRPPTLGEARSVPAPAVDSGHTVDDESLKRGPDRFYKRHLHRKFKNGVLEKNKALLVIRGNHQLPGVDYGEPSSPAMRLESLRTLLALSAIRDLDIIQLDITSSCLHGDTQELYVE